MADERAPDDEELDSPSAPVDAELEDSDFGIDLGKRGDRAEQLSRDEVHVPPVQKVRAAIRTLTERLASAATDRDDAAKKKKADDPDSGDD